MIPDSLKKLVHQEKGVALVLVAAAMTVILGFTALVVDAGALYLARIRLVNACDAAALAGARELTDSISPSSEAMLTAYNYLEQNGIVPEKDNINITTGSTTVTVESSRTVNYTFARVLGFDTGKATARSVATYGSVSAINGIVPLGVPEQEFAYGQEYTLKAASQDDYGPGNYGALALGGSTGADAFRANLANGYQGMIQAGNWCELTEPGSMTGPTKQGLEDRISRCTHSPTCSIDNYSPDCPLVMIVPVFNPDSINGRSEVQIVGFAAFLLKTDEPITGKKITGYFLQTVPPAGLEFEVDPSQTGYGLKSARLVE